jgi:hypothetical protein
MNKKIQALAIVAFFDEATDVVSDKIYTFNEEKMQKFAELIVRECKENFAKVWYEQGVDCRGAELGKFMTRFEEHFGVEE